MNKKAIEMSMNTLVIMVLGVVVIGAGLLLVAKIMNILPETEQELGSPSLIGAEVYPSQGLKGTVFRIIAETKNNQEDIFSVVAQVSEGTGEAIELYDDGLHGDKERGDGVYAGVWDSSDFLETGKQKGQLFVNHKDDKSSGNFFTFEILEESCKNILVSGDSNEKIDILVIGQDYNSVVDFKIKAEEYIDLNSGSNGLFSYGPFIENKDLFNIYTLDRLLTEKDTGCKIGCQGKDSLVCCDNYKIKRLASECPSDKIIVLINNGKFCGSASGYAKACTGGNQNQARVLVHEIGHLFGLGDEYDYGKNGGLLELARYNFDNCVKDCADFPSEAVDYGEVGCYAGCGYGNLFRSVESDSIMYEYANVFNAVSIYSINKVFEKYQDSGVEEESEELGELSAPVVSEKQKQYVVELVLNEQGLSIGEKQVYVVPGIAEDRKDVDNGYEIRILNRNKEVLYKSLFEINKAIFPFSDGEIIFEESVEDAVTIPYYENASIIEIYDSNGQKVGGFDVGYFSSKVVEEGKVNDFKSSSGINWKLLAIIIGVFGIIGIISYIIHKRNTSSRLRNFK